jgi:hypothetical protein
MTGCSRLTADRRGAPQRRRTALARSIGRAGGTDADQATAIAQAARLTPPKLGPLAGTALIEVSFVGLCPPEPVTRDGGSNGGTHGASRRSPLCRAGLTQIRAGGFWRR